MARNESQRPFTLVYVEGNLGVGKSTLLDMLKLRRYAVFHEDVDFWRTELDNFYRDPSLYAYELQLKIIESFQMIFDEISRSTIGPNEIVFVERSPESALVFSRVALQNGHLTMAQFDDIQRRSNELKRPKAMTTVRVKLSSTITRCMKMVRQRGRACELSIGDDNLRLYLHRIDDAFRKHYKFDVDVACDDKSPVQVADAVLYEIYYFVDKRSRPVSNNVCSMMTMTNKASQQSIGHRPIVVCVECWSAKVRRDMLDVIDACGYTTVTDPKDIANGRRLRDDEYTDGLRSELDAIVCIKRKRRRLNECARDNVVFVDGSTTSQLTTRSVRCSLGYIRVSDVETLACLDETEPILADATILLRYVADADALAIADKRSSDEFNEMLRDAFEKTTFSNVIVDRVVSDEKALTYDIVKIAMEYVAKHRAESKPL